MATLPQTLTPYHAKYYAYELTRRCPPDSDDRLANALVDAQVDLNPHQIDAALESPLAVGDYACVSIVADLLRGSTIRGPWHHSSSAFLATRTTRRASRKR